MTSALMLLTLQGVLGAFDNVWNHEWRERLPARPGARRELVLHAFRGGLYAPVFLSFGWLRLEGALGWLFIAVLAVELGITLADFVEEDRARRLSRVERVTHTILTLNYGAFLALAAPDLIRAALLPAGVTFMSHGWLSVLMTVYALGSAGFALREMLAARRLARMIATLPKAAALPSGRTVLLTGGSGFIGRAVTRRLLERGDKAIVLSRNPAMATAVLGPVRVVGALEEIDSREPIHAVVNLAGAPIFGRPWTKAQKRVLVASRIGLTRALVDWLATRAQRPEVLVSASAVGWYGTGEATRDETAPVGGDFPALLCNAWEREAVRAAALGIRVCRLRLGLVLAADGGFLSALLATTRLGLAARIGDGRQWISWIHRDDAVEMIARAIADPLFAGAINATAPAPVRQADFAQAIGRTLHRPVRFTIPARPLRFALGEMAGLLTEGQCVAPRRAREIGFVFRHTEIEPALRDLLAPRESRHGATLRLLDHLLT
ncbi:MAG TPA: TIGR01777 family oxidoreductase [Candidatus Cybelea sp.]|nr:TIGR01777 family oxidoreductase [Candidatus Cybelea sp.]